MDENKIKFEAKEIMDNFMKALKNCEVEEEFILNRSKSFRNEGDSILSLDEDFKQRFLTNAPKISGEGILANKGAWVE